MTPNGDWRHVDTVWHESERTALVVKAQDFLNRALEGGIIWVFPRRHAWRWGGSAIGIEENVFTKGYGYPFHSRLYEALDRHVSEQFVGIAVAGPNGKRL